MTDTQITAAQQAETAVQARLKDLEEENELLLLQLHQVQEELESYFLKCQELERSRESHGIAPAPVGGWVDDELPAMQAEVSRLTTLVETQTRLHDIASRNALNARLGDILIQSVSPGGSLIGLPARLIAIWRASTSDQPPARLGGKNFDKVIETFQAGGPESVSQLLAAEPAPEMRAKAWTALARHQMKSGLFADAAHSARRAYEEEPKPYRLKWLAFRLHDAGEIAEADACLSLLPQDTPFSDSEARQRDQVRYEAKNARLREARHNSDFDARRQAMESQMLALRQDRDNHTRLAAERQEEVRSLRQALAKLETDISVIARKQEASTKLFVAREEEIASLQQVKNQFEQEALELSKKQEESAKLLVVCEAEIASLHQVNIQFEQEALALSKRQEEFVRLLADREAEIASLNQVNIQFEQEAFALSKNQEELVRLLADRETEIASLHQVNIRFEQESLALSKKQEEFVRLLADREAEIASLHQVNIQLEQESLVLKKTIGDANRVRDEQTALDHDRTKLISELQRKLEEKKAAEIELENRQQIIREELTRVEAQIDLMKDIFLRESGL